MSLVSINRAEVLYALSCFIVDAVLELTSTLTGAQVQKYELPLQVPCSQTCSFSKISVLHNVIKQYSLGLKVYSSLCPPQK